MAARRAGTDGKPHLTKCLFPRHLSFHLFVFFFFFFFTHLTLGFGIFLVGKGEGIGMDGW